MRLELATLLLEKRLKWNVCFFQLIDLSMSTSDDPKEPYFFSVLPWIVLYRIIKHEEGAFDCVLQQHMSVGDEGLFHVLTLFLYSGLKVVTSSLAFR